MFALRQEDGFLAFFLRLSCAFLVDGLLERLHFGDHLSD